MEVPAGRTNLRPLGGVGARVGPVGARYVPLYATLEKKDSGRKSGGGRKAVAWKNRFEAVE